MLLSGDATSSLRLIVDNTLISMTLSILSFTYRGEGLGLNPCHGTAISGIQDAKAPRDF